MTRLSVPPASLLRAVLVILVGYRILIQLDPFQFDILMYYVNILIYYIPIGQGLEFSFAIIFL